jgi:hypothetical protein
LLAGSHSALALSRLIARKSECHFVPTKASRQRPKKYIFVATNGHGLPRKQTKDRALQHKLPTKKAAARKKEDDNDVYSPVNKKKRASSSM